MNKAFLLSFSITLTFVLLLSMTLPVYAALNIMNLVSETNTTYTTRSGSPWQTRAEGFQGNSYQSFNRYLPSHPLLSMAWYCKETYSANYYWHLYVAIPYNTGYTDGRYNYSAYNKKVDGTTYNFSIPVNQEHFANEWAYLGWTLGKG